MTSGIEINKNTWTEIISDATQAIVTPPDLSKTYLIFYKFQTTQPTAGIVGAAHRYSQTEYSEGFVTGSSITPVCWALLDKNCPKDTIDLAVTDIA